ncbi:MAG: YihY/virulence factor BrkB family protein [Bacteroides sp.]|nr:YihY/virulence factor BrkB family protein [Bacteroides sp.]MCM1445208.1 YihY/virulence factor BrkB family protein [Prevotella sp.]
MKRKAVSAWNYALKGVWHDRRNSLWVRIVKTINLTVKSFLSADLQSTACALTYRLLLAIVPALALLFAIGRGFGFQNILSSQLISYFPSQRHALEVAMQFVDSYLAQASEGLFVGVGIVVLLWTLISLISSVEDAFNRIWCIKSGRTMWRKITDYTAIFIILPILMVCGSGLTAFMQASVEDYLPFMTPLLTAGLDIASVVFIWLFFTGLYMLVPNTKVKFKNALPAGILAGVAYQVLQWLFVSGQLYVSKYNAIYGGFAFLPLLLIWLQLVWLFTLTGALLCYSAQSISDYALDENIYGISFNYRRRIGVGLLAVMVQRYIGGKAPLSATDFERSFGVPLRLVQILLAEMEDMHLIIRVSPANRKGIVCYQPARDLAQMTVGEAVDTFRDHGTTDFIPEFNTDFKSLADALNAADDASLAASTQPLGSLPLKSLGSTNLNHIITN